MRNHGEKTKNMQRSVLPSTSRKTAREERRRIHKRARARERDTLTEARKTVRYPRLAASTEQLDDLDGDADFREGRRKQATHWMKWDRRVADKVGPLTRWAVRTVEADPHLRDAALHDQVAYFEALLPGDLIGKHAVSHIYWALKWELHRDTISRYGGPPAGPSCEERRDQVAADARRILETGRHKALNSALRSLYDEVRTDRWGHVVALPHRLLLGLHDVGDFAEEISRHPMACTVVAGVADRR